MKKANDKLACTKTGYTPININTTHLYVRFLAKNLTEYDSIKRDATLHLYDHPLDYEIVGLGNYYHDPTLPDTSITWRYCNVRANYKLPNFIEYQILNELYIP